MLANAEIPIFKYDNSNFFIKINKIQLFPVHY